MSHAVPFTVPRRAPSGEDLAVGLRILADLLAAGLSLTRALGAFTELAPPGWREAAAGLRDQVHQGAGLSLALENSSLGLPPIVVGIIRAGEAGGGTPDAVRRAADHLDAMEEARTALRNALAYPAAVAVAGALAIVLMISVVLPRFERLLGDLGQSLPASTRLVLGAADLVRTGAGPMLAISMLLVLAGRQLLLDPAHRRRWHALLLSVPVIGSVRSSIMSAHICGALAALLESGVPLRAGLAQVAQVVPDDEIRARLEAGRTAIIGGAGVGRTFRTLSIVTPTAARLAAAGEETGGLPSMLAFAARLERGRADRSVRTLVRLVEPTLILAFAGIVALVAAALLQAVYAVRPA